MWEYSDDRLYILRYELFVTAIKELSFMTISIVNLDVLKYTMTHDELLIL
jgi:hypothetical protein